MPRFVVVRKLEEYDGAFSDAELFAVRSSCSAEDSPKASFAGQYETYLNVSREDVPGKIQMVLQSAQTGSAEAYREARNISAEADEVCVIVQEMVEADCAGVVFTANPVGILNEMVVVVGEGLGDGVVEDQIPTTSYFYNTDDAICCCQQQEGACLLEGEVLDELLDMASEIRTLWGQHMDIEYAVKDRAVYILQARPITTLSGRAPIVLDSSNIAESYPGVSLPLTQSFVQEVYYGIFQSCIRRITKSEALAETLDEHVRHMTAVANWRIYYRISNWYAVLYLLPFSRRITHIWQDMLGVTNLSVSLPEGFSVSNRTRLTVFKSFLHYLHRTPALMAELNQRFEQQYEVYGKQIADSQTIKGLLEVYASIRDSILMDWDITLINDMYAFLYTALSGKNNRALLADIKNLESMKPADSIRRLTHIAQKYGMDSEEYREKAAEHIAQYGDRCLMELKLETKTYRTNPELLDIYVTRQMEEGDEIVTQERETGNFFVKRARLGIQNREISRLNRSRLYGMARSIFLKIGGILQEQSHLAAAEDVFYLYLPELHTDGDFTELVEERKKEAHFYEQIPPYTRLVFDGKIINRTGLLEHTELLNRPHTLSGIGISLGHVTGEVLVVEEPKDTMNTAGKILVTRSTDPGWVFLMQNAVGIIAEKGSLLSHTAIIARELHKPAIVNVKDCTSILKTGDMVHLDAETGVVTIVR